MKKTMILVTLAALLAALQAEASSRSTRPGESIGVVGGVAVGLAAAGPAGALVGGALGAYLGNSVEDANKLDAAEAELAATRSDLETVNRELGRVRLANAAAEERMAELAERLAAAPDAMTLGGGIEFDVYYRTGDTKVGDSTDSRLRELAVLISKLPGVRVELDGYADPRGGEEFNLTLSRERIEGVVELLLGGGVDRDRIETFAHGASRSTAADKDLDAYALERRVAIRLVPNPGTGQVARSD